MAIFAGSTVPALVAVLPLVLGASWYLTDDANAAFLTPVRVRQCLVAFLLGVAPFLAAVASLTSAVASGRGLASALRVAAVWAGPLGVLAFAYAGLWAGGF
jgi:hypothetical protein